MILEILMKLVKLAKYVCCGMLFYMAYMMYNIDPTLVVPIELPAYVTSMLLGIGLLRMAP